MNQSTEKVQNLERGRRLVEERKRMQLSQPALADAGGVKKGSQILYEKGNAPTADYLAGIAAAGADVLYILTGQRAPTSAAETVINTARLAEAIEVVERGLHEAGRSLAPDVKAEVIIAAYDILSEPTDAAVSNVLRLVKA